LGHHDEGTASPASARGKLRRAHCHIENLRTSIREAGQGEPYRLPLRIQDEPETGGKTVRVGALPNKTQEWGLLIGDAVHNLRCALDHVWWALAIKHLDREPTEQEAPSIQFPILEPGGNWDPGNYPSWVGEEATEIVAEAQPRNGLDGDEVHPLAVLRVLSNADKHRVIPTTVHVLTQTSITLRRTPDATETLTGNLGTGHTLGDKPVQEGDVVFTIPAGSLLLRPDVKYEADLTGYVAISGRWDAVAILDAIGTWAATLVHRLEPLL
jgi:hypothetical protein